MSQPKMSEADFIRLFTSLGPAKMAAETGLSVRGIYSRRERIEAKVGRQIEAPTNQFDNNTRAGVSHPKKIDIEVPDGHVLVASDAHYWPSEVTTAHRAFVKLARKLKPRAVIMNGDVFDGASISRHPPIGWEDAPTVEEEVGTCQKRLREIQKAAPNAQLLWNLGNHDGRFETRLATVAPQFAKVHGVHLKDHFPDWAPSWAVWINDDVVVKHRFKGGIHATHNNTLWAGKSTVTGHLHSLKVTPFSDYGGTRFGVDTGTLADVYGPQFEGYTETNPVNWRSGFAVLKFVNGRLMWPQVCHVLEQGKAEYLGEVFDV